MFQKSKIKPRFNLNQTRKTFQNFKGHHKDTKVETTKQALCPLVVRMYFHCNVNSATILWTEQQKRN